MRHIALCVGPWLVGDNYLHVQQWCPTFTVVAARINMLPVWVCFPILPVEYYTENWLWETKNFIGKTIKVYGTTLAASRGKFARVCIEVDLNKPLLATFRMRDWIIKSNMKVFKRFVLSVGEFGHREVHCVPTLKGEAEGVGEGGTKQSVEENTSTEVIVIRKQLKQPFAHGLWRKRIVGD